MIDHNPAPTSIFASLAADIENKSNGTAVEEKQQSSEEKVETNSTSVTEEKVETEKVETEKKETEGEDNEEKTWVPEFDATGQAIAKTDDKGVKTEAPKVAPKPVAARPKTDIEINAEIMAKAKAKGLDPVAAVVDAQVKDLSKLTREEKLSKYFNGNTDEIEETEEYLKTLNPGDRKKYVDGITKELQEIETARAKAFTESLGLTGETETETIDPVAEQAAIQNLFIESVSTHIDSVTGKEIYGVRVTPEMAADLKTEYKKFVMGDFEYCDANGKVNDQLCFDLIFFKKYGLQAIKENGSRAYSAGVLAERTRKSNPDKNYSGGTVPTKANQKTEVQQGIDAFIGRKS